MKTCACCKEVKELIAFGEDKKRKDGHNPYCRVCIQKKTAAAYLKHKEKIAERNLQWRTQNRERYLEYQKTWNKTNKDYIDAWNANNKETINARGREWKKANKAKVQCDTRMRQARKAKATPSWANKQEIQYYYNLAVYFTEMSGGFVKYHVDHIVPLRGKDVCGLHVQNNLQVLKSVDNLRKSNKCQV